MKKYIYLSIGMLFLFDSCKSPERLNYYKLSGFAQGTSYHITYGVQDSINYQEPIDSLLRDFDLSLSTYDSASLISKINRNEDVLIDKKFRKVFEVSREVNRVSEGAFDITVMPLVNAWGFGPGKRTKIEPGIIDSIMEFVGMDKVKLEADHLVKANPGVSLDVNAIAQGYSVDLVAELLEKKGIRNFMVEIGGEVRTTGRNPEGKIWKIGIDRPEYGNMIPGIQMQAIIELKDRALATSGNYRKFYEENGIKYTHSIDPKTGYPARHEILSATVIANDCISADAYATACMVMGLEKAKELILDSEELDVYLIYGDAEGQYQVWSDPEFEKYILKEDPNTRRE